MFIIALSTIMPMYSLIAQTSSDFNDWTELFKRSPLVAVVLFVVVVFIRYIDRSNERRATEVEKIHERYALILHDSKTETTEAMSQIVNSNQSVIAPLIEAINTNTEVVRSNIPVLSRVEKVLDLSVSKHAQTE